jgi:hypothetical protein
MASKLNQMLGYRNMSSVVRSPDGGLPASFPQAFLTLTKQVDGDSTAWDIYESTRQSAKITAPGSAAVQVTQMGVSNRAAKLLHSFESMRHSAEVLLSLRKAGDTVLDSKGAMELARQSAEFKRRFQNLRIAAVLSGLTLGKIYLKQDTTGPGFQILPSSSGATVTIDLGVPAANLTTLNGIIDFTWNSGNASLSIAKQIEAIQDVQVQAGNPAIKYAIYGPGVINAVRADPLTAAIIAGNPQIANGFASGVVPNLYGLTWIPATGDFIEAPDGTKTKMLTNKCIFVPEITRDWYEMHEGSSAVPNSYGAASDAADAASLVDVIYGMFSYAKIIDNPVGIEHFCGDKFLPTFKVPTNVFCGTVLS